MRGFTRFIGVLLIVWILARTMIYVLPGDPAEFLVHESLVPIDPETLRQKMNLGVGPIARIFSWPGSESLVRREPIPKVLAEAVLHTLLLTFYSIFFAIPSVIGLLFLHFKDGRSRRWANGAGFSLACVPTLISGPLILLLLPLPPPLAPALCLGLSLTAFWYRALSRRLEKSILESPVAGARARGLPESSIFFRHLLAPSLGSFILYFGTQLGALLNGSVLVESIFHVNGLGSLIADAVLSRDYPVIESGILAASLMTLTAQQLGYRVQLWWDPKLS